MKYDLTYVLLPTDIQVQSSRRLWFVVVQLLPNLLPQNVDLLVFRHFTALLNMIASGPSYTCRSIAF